MTIVSTDADLIYPDSDGQPTSDNTKQFRWIVLIKENLEILFANDSQVFVAGDLLWYPVQGRPEIRVAPDAMVVFGRPKGDRGSYKQWEEGNIAPQVVFEVLSPGNTLSEMSRKLLFYEHHGAEEYYVYDPDRNTLDGFIRRELNSLESIGNIQGWVSPRLGIRFELTDIKLVIYRPDGEAFLTPVELRQQLEAGREKAKAAQAQAEQEQQRAEAAQAQVESAQVQAKAAKSQAKMSQAQADLEKRKAESALVLADRLAARLRELGVDPEI
jgi:Uma2 family endonuclease